MVFSTGESARKTALLTASYIPFFILKDKSRLVKPTGKKNSAALFGQFPHDSPA
jgi:hypothetical protein